MHPLLPVPINSAPREAMSLPHVPSQIAMSEGAGVGPFSALIAASTVPPAVAVTNAESTMSGSAVEDSSGFAKSLGETDLVQFADIGDLARRRDEGLPPPGKGLPLEHGELPVEGGGLARPPVPGGSATADEVSQERARLRQAVEPGSLEESRRASELPSVPGHGGRLSVVDEKALADPRSRSPNMQATAERSSYDPGVASAEAPDIAPSLTPVHPEFVPHSDTVVQGTIPAMLANSSPAHISVREAAAGRQSTVDLAQGGNGTPAIVDPRLAQAASSPQEATSLADIRKAKQTEPKTAPITAPANALEAGPSASLQQAAHPMFAASGTITPQGQPGQASPSPSLVAQAAPAIEQVVEQLAQLREAAQVSRPEILMRHAEFGLVSLRVEGGANDLKATLTSRDPGFVPAVQAGIAERAVAAAADTGSASQRGSEQGAGQNPQHSFSQSSTQDHGHGQSQAFRDASRQLGELREGIAPHPQRDAEQARSRAEIDAGKRDGLYA